MGCAPQTALPPAGQAHGLGDRAGVEAVAHEPGTHLIADFWGVRTIDVVPELERVLRAAVTIAHATLLELRLHQFPGHGGITGYALLAESHISVHTWPERDYVAIDVFMCGEHRPLESLDVLRRAFRPERESVRSIRRGIAPAVSKAALAPSAREPLSAGRTPDARRAPDARPVPEVPASSGSAS